VNAQLDFPQPHLLLRIPINLKQGGQKMKMGGRRNENEEKKEGNK
jgi:hypothetical protein